MLAVVAALTIALAAPSLVATARADDPPPTDTPPTDPTPPPPSDDQAPATDPIPPTPADTTPPDTVLDGTPAALTNSGAATFTFHSSEDGSTFQCTLDGGSASDCSSPLSLSGLADGAHTLSVAATDVAGNQDPSPASYSWTVDTTAPAAPVGLATTSVTSTGVALTWSAAPDGDVASYTVLRDGAALGTTTTPSYSDATVVAGTSYSYAVVAVDQVGNASQPGDPLGVDVPANDPSPGLDPEPGTDPAPDPGTSPAPAPAPAPPPPAPAPPASPAQAPAPATQPTPTPTPAAVSDPVAPSATADAAALGEPVLVSAAAPQSTLHRSGAGEQLARFLPAHAILGARAGLARAAATSVSLAAAVCKLDQISGATPVDRTATRDTHDSRAAGGAPAKRPPLQAPGRGLPPTDGGGSSSISGSFGGAGGAHGHGGEAGLATRVLPSHRAPVGRLLSLAQPPRRALGLHFLLERPG